LQGLPAFVSPFDRLLWLQSHIPAVVDLPRATSRCGR
jgi:hypothetical protein